MILVIGVMADKDIGKLLRAIVPLADHVIYTRPVYSRAADPQDLMAEAEPLGKPGEIAPLIAKALTRAKELADSRDLVVVCGSLFTVGEALAYIGPEIYKPDDPQ